MSKRNGEDSGARRARFGQPDEILRIVASPHESAVIRERARTAGKSISAFLRDLGVQGPVTSAISHAVMVDLLKAAEAYDSALSSVEAMAAKDTVWAPQLRQVVEQGRALQRHLEDVAFRG
jgi:hypothetical protein